MGRAGVDRSWGRPGRTNEANRLLVERVVPQGWRGARRPPDEAGAQRCRGGVGPGVKEAVIVCASEETETTERGLGSPARVGRVLLTLALDRLADLYGIE